MSHANPIDGGYVLLPWVAIRLGAARMAKGLEDHARDSWRNMSQEELVEHAAEHLGRYLEGDGSEDHLLHAMLRLMMAVEVRQRELPDPVPV